MSRDVHRYTHWLRPRNSPPPPAFGLGLRGRYWSAKIIDGISLQPPDFYVSHQSRVTTNLGPARFFALQLFYLYPIVIKINNTWCWHY
jgi:hypothetical protein